MSSNQRCSAYSITESQAQLGHISRQTIYNLINAGRLKTFRIGRRRFCSDQAIRECIATLEAKEANGAEAA